MTASYKSDFREISLALQRFQGQKRIINFSPSDKLIMLKLIVQRLH